MPIHNRIGDYLSPFNNTMLSPWEVKTADFTAGVGHRYQVDCTLGTVTMTLPAGMIAGDEIHVEDAALSFTTHALLINPASSGFGNKVNGMAGGYIDSVIGDKLSIVAISSGYGTCIK